jgi:putative ABC transport system substrate-binding protein
LESIARSTRQQYKRATRPDFGHLLRNESFDQRNASNPGPQEIPGAARQLDVQIILVEARTADEIEPAINAAVSQRAEALFIQGDPVWQSPPERVPQIVARTGLPAIYFSRTQAQAGGLMSFGPDFVALSRRAASYVDRILKGARPGDLAIEQPTKIDLVINLKTAKAIGLTIPQSLQIQAELIE